MPIGQITGPISHPLVLDRGYSVSITPLAGSCRVQIPGEAVSETLTAAASYGPYSARREAVISINSGIVEYDVDEAGGSPGQSSVSGVPVVADFAALLAIASPQAGWRAVVAAPVIAGGPGYTRWVHDGAVWRLDGPQDLLVDTTPTVPGGGGTAELVLRSIALPAGLLASLRYMRVAMVMAKSGSTETGTVRLRLGSAGTTADVSVGLASYAAANRQLAFCHEGFASTATQWRAKLNGFVSPVSGGYGTSSVYPANYGIPATSGALQLSITAAMSASVEIPSIADLVILGG